MSRLFPITMSEHEVYFGGDDSLFQSVRAAVDAVAFDLLESRGFVEVPGRRRQLRPGIALEVIGFPDIVANLIV